MVSLGGCVKLTELEGTNQQLRESIRQLEERLLEVENQLVALHRVMVQVLMHVAPAASGDSGCEISGQPIPE